MGEPRLSLNTLFYSLSPVFKFSGADFFQARRGDGGFSKSVQQKSSVLVLTLVTTASWRPRRQSRAGFTRFREPVQKRGRCRRTREESRVDRRGIRDTTAGARIPTGIEGRDHQVHDLVPYTNVSVHRTLRCCC